MVPFLRSYHIYIWGVWTTTTSCGAVNHVRLKCTKNYKYVFWYLFDVAITNARILHSFDVQSGAQMDHKHFRLKLAEQLIGSYRSRKRVGRPRKRPSQPSNDISTNHFPTHSAKKSAVYTAEMFGRSLVGRSLCGCVPHVTVSQPCA